ncbi:hypothetical protein J2774_005034 [Rhizobium pusense]|nr:hypothetical protein [Agrobacterium pusense]
MRHNPASGAIVIMLRQLKMHGMAQAVGELTEQGSPAFEAAVPILSQLLKAETAEREVRSTAYQLKTARFPAYRDLNGFDFTSSEINEALVRQLHRCEFLDDANNIVLVGGPGTGKTHSRRQSAFRPSSIITSGFGSSRPSRWSTRWNRRRRKDGLGRSPTGSHIPISSSSMSSDTCRSVRQAVRCCSIC